MATSVDGTHTRERENRYARIHAAWRTGDLMIQQIIRHYAEQSGVSLKSETSAGTVAIPRENKEGKVWFVVNMDGNGGGISIPGEALMH